MPEDFNYYRIEDVENLRYYQMPKLFFEDDKFKDLSDAAIILYSLLRDRTDLSKKNNWIDEHGRVYIVYTIAEIMADTRWGNKKAGKTLSELQEFGLIQKYRKTMNSAYRIYVMNLCSISTCQSDTSRDVKTTSPEMSKRHPNDTNNNKTDSLSYKRAQNRAPKKANFNNFEQRDYDYDALEESLINRPMLQAVGSDTG